MKLLFKLARIILSGMLLMASLSTIAGDHDKDEHRQHSSHEHGAALLNISIEGTSLNIEFESPAMNIIGFEHAPKNTKQKQAVKQAAIDLKNAEKLFDIPAAAQCSLTKADVESPLLEEKNEEHEQHKDEKQKETHNEFHANYTFECKQISALKNINVLLFKKFRATNEIRVQLITNDSQTVKKLTASNFTLVFFNE